MTDRENMTKMRDDLIKERDSFGQAIAALEQQLAGHRAGYQRADGSIVVLNKLLEGEEEAAAIVPPKALNGRGKKAQRASA